MLLKEIRLIEGKLLFITCREEERYWREELKNRENKIMNVLRQGYLRVIIMKQNESLCYLKLITCIIKVFFLYGLFVFLFLWGIILFLVDVVEFISRVHHMLKKHPKTLCFFRFS